MSGDIVVIFGQVIIKTNLKGNLGKVKECFNNTSLKSYKNFKEVDKKKVLKIKQEIRNICKAKNTQSICRSQI